MCHNSEFRTYKLLTVSLNKSKWTEQNQKVYQVLQHLIYKEKASSAW